MSNKDVADRATALAAPFAQDGGEQPAGGRAARLEKQILLRIKFAELDRSAANSFAVNLVSTGATNTIGARQRPASSPRPTAFERGRSHAKPPSRISNALNIFAFRPDLNLGAFIEALEHTTCCRSWTSRI